MSRVFTLPVDLTRLDANDQVVLYSGINCKVLGVSDVGFSGMAEIAVLDPNDYSVTEPRRFEFVRAGVPLSVGPWRHEYVGRTDAYFVFEVIANQPAG